MDRAPHSTSITTEITEQRAEPNVPLDGTSSFETRFEDMGIMEPMLPKKTSKTSINAGAYKWRRMRNNSQYKNQEEVHQLETQLPSYTTTLRIIKVVSLLLIGACALLGMVFSKITFVSIASRIYTLYSHPSAQDDKSRDISKIFFQLVFMLIIPEIVCLNYCLLWGFIGKSSKTKPWPSRKAICLVRFFTTL